MAGFSNIVSAPVSKATSIAVLAGCLLLGVLIGTHTSAGTNNNANLRTAGSQVESATVGQQQQQHKPMDKAEMQARVAGAKFVNLASRPKANEEEADAGAEADFAWAGHFFEDYDFDTLAMLEDMDSSPSYYLADSSPSYYLAAIVDESMSYGFD